MKDFYSELEVKPDATSEEIKESYRRLAKEYHPDRLPPGTPDKARRYIEEKFKSLQEAYSVLSDPVKRKAYDSQRLSQTKGNERDLGLKAKPSYSTQDGSTWPFDPDKIQKAAEEIELRRRRIETNYNQKIEQVKSELKRNLILIGIKEEDARVDYTFLICLFVFGLVGFLRRLGMDWCYTRAHCFGIRLVGIF